MTVARDHEKWLGYELSEIATEKLGILKPEATLISAPQDPDVLDLVRQTVAKNRASYVQYGENLAVLSRESAVGSRFSQRIAPAAVYEDVPHWPCSATTKLPTPRWLSRPPKALFGGGAWSGDVVEHALMATNSPGRMEIVKKLSARSRRRRPQPPPGLRPRSEHWMRLSRYPRACLCRYG